MAATDAVAAAGSSDGAGVVGSSNGDELPSGEPVYNAPTGIRRCFTSLALTRVLPWRRFSKGSTLVIEVRPAAERVTSAQAAASASKDSTALPLVQFASLGLLRHFQIFT